MDSIYFAQNGGRSNKQDKQPKKIGRRKGKQGGQGIPTYFFDTDEDRNINQGIMLGLDGTSVWLGERQKIIYPQIGLILLPRPLYSGGEGWGEGV